MAKSIETVRAIVGDGGKSVKTVRVGNAAELAEMLGGTETGGGGTGSRKVYEHNQSVTAAEWRITHSLGTKYPTVLVFGEDGGEIRGFIDYANATVNYIEIQFFAPVKGKAVISN